MAYKKVIRVVPRKCTPEEIAICDAALEVWKAIRYAPENAHRTYSDPIFEAGRATYYKAMRDVGVLCTAKQNGIAYFGIFTDEEWGRVRDVS